MSLASESRAETVKLARLLGVEDLQALAFLLRVPAPELRDYREAVTDLLYDQERELLQRTADASRLLPARMAASIAERALGPLVCARLTGLLDPRRAAEISDHLTVDFIAACFRARSASSRRGCDRDGNRHRGRGVHCDGR